VCNAISFATLDLYPQQIKPSHSNKGM